MCSRPLTLCPRDRVVYWQKQGLVELVRGAIDALGLWRDCNFFFVTGCVCVLSYFSRVWFFVTPWTVACQAPLSMGFSRQEYWSGLPCPPPGDLPDPGIEPMSLMSPALADGFFQANAGLPCYLKPWYSFKSVSRVQKNKNKKAGVSIWSRKNRASWGKAQLTHISQQLTQTVQGWRLLLCVYRTGNRTECPFFLPQAPPFPSLPSHLNSLGLLLWLHLWWPQNCSPMPLHLWVLFLYL